MRDFSVVTEHLDHPLPALLVLLTLWLGFLCTSLTMSH